jgi:hypothetical protein
MTTWRPVAAARLLSILVLTVFFSLELPAGAQTLSVTSLNLGNVVIDTTSAARTLLFTNNQTTPLTITSFSVSGDFAATSGCPIAPKTLAAGAACNISVTYTPTVLAAETGTLTVSDNASTSPQTIPLTGTGVPPVTVTPPAFNFGNQAIGTTGTARTVAVMNYETVPLTITGISITGNYSTTTTCPVSPNTLAARASCTIAISFAPAATGTLTGTLTVSSNASNSPQSVALTGSGISPVVLSPTTLAYASQLVGTSSAAKVISVKNNQSTALTINSIATSGPFSETSSCPAPPSTLAANTACNVSVVFTPTAGGATTGVLTVSDSASTSPQTLALTGTGGVAVTLSPTTRTFPAVHVNQTSAPLTFTLTNNEAAALTISSISTTSGFAQTSNCPVSPSTLATSTSCTISVTFSASQVGTATGTLTIVDSASATPLTAALSGSANLTGLLSIAVTPKNPAPMFPNTQVQLTATGTFANQTTANLTDIVSWTSSVPTFAQVNSAGLVQTVAAGQAVVVGQVGYVSGQTTINVANPAPTRITVSPANPTQPVGAYQQFTAQIHYNNNVNLESTSALSWSSTSNTTATVNQSGLVAAASPGSTTIQASYGSVTGSTTFNVTQPTCTTAPAGLVDWWTGDGNAVDIAGSNSATLQNVASYSTGEVAQAFAFPTSGASILVNSPVYSPSGTLMFWFMATSPGAITGGYAGGSNRAPGFMIDSSGNLDWEYGNLTAQSLGQVNLNQWYHAALAYGASSSGTTSVAVYLNGTLVAHGIASSNTAWNPQVAFGSYIGAQNPGFTGFMDEISFFNVTLSQTQIKTIYSAFSAGMCKPTLQSIAVNPPNPNLAPGLTLPFTAAGTYSDTSVHDLTSSATWSTGSNSVATVSATGLATAVSSSNTTVTAALGSIQASTTLAVKPSLVSIQVTPQNPSTSVGALEPFVATGTFSDGTQQNLTSSVSWTSSSSAATIAVNGTSTSVSPGQSTITATAGSVTGTSLLTVNSATLTSIAITPGKPTIVAGTTEQFTATGTFSDGSKQNLNSSVTWNSSSPNIAPVPVNGATTTLLAGHTTITATLGSVTGTTTLTVSAAAPAQIQISPLSPLMAVDGSQQFTATAIYTDGTSANISSSATWTLTPATVATLNSASPGLAVGAGTGTARIVAAYNGLSASTTLTIQDQVASITLTPSTFSIAAGQTQQFTAVGTFVSGVTQNITQSVTWNSSSSGVAGISSTGLATSTAPGQTTITASLGGVTASATLNVGAPNVVGQWTTLSETMPINPVHVALLNTGQILVISGSGNCGPQLPYCPQGAPYGPSNNSGALLIQPGTWQVVDQFSLTWDMFCNGMVLLQDGTALIDGGTINYYPFEGSSQAAIFNPVTNTFTNTPNMSHGRWYPTMLTLSDGTVMTFSGLSETATTNTEVEIYTMGSGWSTPYTASWTPDLYPRLHLLPNGMVFYSSGQTTSRLYNPSTQTWSTVATTNYGQTRLYGSSVMLPLTPANNYDPVIMILGGSTPATNTTELIDMGSATPTWVYGPNMSAPRIEMNATLLPNGEVLAVGGSVNNEDVSTASLNADLYNPVTNTFSSAGENAFPRLYHSVAVLLPDATVWVAGGNPAMGTYQQTMEIYQPPYLFNPDGSLATQPTITSAPASISYGSSFTVNTPNAANISSVVLVRNPTVTHAFGMDQREVGLSFTAGSGSLTVTAPPNGNIAPPGYYMLFILNSSGVPSASQFVQVTASN